MACMNGTHQCRASMPGIKVGLRASKLVISLPWRASSCRSSETRNRETSNREPSNNSACRETKFHEAPTPHVARMSHAYSACRTHPRLAAGIRFPDTDSLSLTYLHTHTHISRGLHERDGAVSSPHVKRLQLLRWNGTSWADASSLHPG